MGWRFLFWLLGGFRWKPCWVWQPRRPLCPRAKGPDLNSSKPGRNLHQRRGGNGKRSSLPLDPLQKKVEKKMVSIYFLPFHSVNFIPLVISCFSPVLVLRVKPCGTVCFTVPQHPNHEGNLQELCGAPYQHCLGRRSCNSTRTSKRWVNWLFGPNLLLW